MMTPIDLITNTETSSDLELDAQLASMWDDRRHCFGIWTLRFSNHELGECDCCGDRDECEAKVAEERIRAMSWKCFGGGPHDVTRTTDCGYQECGLSDDCKEVADRFFMVDPRVRGKFHDLARKGKLLETEPPMLVANTDASVCVYEDTEALVPLLLESPCGAVGEAVLTHRMSAPLDKATTKAAKITKELPIAPVRVGIPMDGLSYRACKEGYDVYSTAELRSLVYTISHGKVPGAEGIFPYMQVRERFFAVSQVLNERGEIAPRFRERRSVPWPTLLDDDQTYARDLLVIDMHWLYCHHEPSPVPELAHIFSSDGFRFDLAWEYASKSVTSPKRAEFLGLGSFDGGCLSMIHSREAKETWRRLHERRGAMIHRIKDAILRPGSRRKEEDPKMLYDVCRAIEAMDGNVSIACELFALMGYAMPSKTNFDRKIAWLKKAKLWPRPSALVTT